MPPPPLVCVTIDDQQSGHADGDAVSNMKHATQVVGVYFERVGVGTGDRDTLINDQFSDRRE